MVNKGQKSTEDSQRLPQNNDEIYEIKVKGLLDDHWEQWFEGMRIERQENAEGSQESTLIIGPIADQPALHGLLAKIRDLNLTLISVIERHPENSLNHERELDV